MDIIEELLSKLAIEASFGDNSGDDIAIKKQIMNHLQSPEFIVELIGIKKHDNGNWVHPIVGIIEGIDECETQSDVVCKLLEAKHGAPEAIKMLNELGINYDFQEDDDGNYRFWFHTHNGTIAWVSGTHYGSGETVWTRLIDYIHEIKIDKNSWLNKEPVYRKWT